MNMENLREYGINYEAGLARCMGDQDFYKRFLQMFLNDDSYYRANAAFEKQDNAALFDCLHELKGACGNAGLDDLFKAVSPLVELLRGGSADQQQIDTLIKQVELAYNRARDGLTSFLG